MESHNGSEHGSSEAHMVQGTILNPHLTTSYLQQIEAMGNDGAPKFIVDQGLYYPTATNYGYYCTGFDFPGEWDHRFFGYGPDLQYPSIQTDSLPYVYYTPSYGYAQSPYNPYNSYIPGAVIGVDGAHVGTEQDHTRPSYQNPVSLPVYYPFGYQPRPNMIPDYSPYSSSLNTAISSVGGPEGPGLQHNPLSVSAGVTSSPASGHMKAKITNSASDQSHLLNEVSEGSKIDAALNKQLAMHRSVTSGSVLSAPLNVAQGKSASGSIQATDRFSIGRATPFHKPSRFDTPVTNGLSEFVSNPQVWGPRDRIRSRVHYSGVSNEWNGSRDMLIEQNRGPRSKRIRNQWPSSITIKAYASKTGACNALGNTIIYTDQYNNEDFPVDYENAKFFVIKSYSEDDIHKSIKYNVWSSTANGNKRLDSAYEVAQRIAAGKPRGCPVFLFFSVNGSGQFCGVAEMIGPVDFHKDMDFWNKDKWSGSFPVKWHMIKDVRNTDFRHIILENNENKPVTNSRDTQEIIYNQGLEMLNIFKNCTWKTSILHDFMYYEDRQKISQEGIVSLVGKSFDNSLTVPPSISVSTVDLRTVAEEKFTERHDPNIIGKLMDSSNEQVPLKSVVAISSNDSAKQLVGDVNDVTSVSKIGSISITPKQAEAKPSVAASLIDATAVDTEAVVVAIGSMSVKVDVSAESSSGYLRVGTIPLDLKALKLDEAGSQACHLCKQGKIFTCQVMIHNRLLAGNMKCAHNAGLLAVASIVSGSCEMSDDTKAFRKY